MNNDRAQDDAAFFAERGFGLTIGFGKKPALLVVDLVNAFTDSTRLLGAPLEAQIGATQHLLTSARDRNIPIFFSTVMYDDVDLKDAGIWALKQKGVTTLRADGDGHLVDARLSRQKSEALIVKKYASCFFGTDLITRLNSYRVDTLILAGCTTSGCIRASAVDACQNGFRPMVVQQAVGDRSEAAHKQSLFDLNAKYADVVQLQQTVDYLQKLPKNDA